MFKNILNGICENIQCLLTSELLFENLINQQSTVKDNNFIFMATCFFFHQVTYFPCIFGFNNLFVKIMIKTPSNRIFKEQIMTYLIELSYPTLVLWDR